METRRLGKNGPELTVMGLGTWAIGGPWAWGWGEQNDNDSIAAIQASLKNGVNWIDTAPIYGLGHAETVVAQALRDVNRQEVFIATKCGLVWDDRGRIDRTLRPESIRREIDASLKRLNTDYVDLYQHHWTDPTVPIEDSWGEMVRIQEQGKARFIGVCNYDETQLQQCMAIAPVQSLQPPYSMVRRDIEKRILPYCQENEIGVVAYSPLQTGLLTGKFSRERLHTLPEDDFRRKDPYFKEPLFSKILQFVERIRPLAEDRGFTVAHLAIAWVLKHPAVTSAIVGARNAQQAEENALAANLELDEAMFQEIEQAYAETVGTH